MNKKVGVLLLSLAMMFSIAACRTKDEPAASAPQQQETQTESAPAANTDNTASETRAITYLGKEYTVPVQPAKLVITGSVESLEDALVLDVHPAGAMTTGGEFAPMFAKITDQAEGIGEKSQPNLEAILKLKPDVILASTKFPAEAIEKLSKIAVTIPVSHIATDWQDNLNLLAELSGKQEQAKQALQNYNDEVQALKGQIGPVLQDKNVLILRLRAGNLFIYPEDVFFNPSVYADLGASVPEEVKKAEAQQMVTIEQLSQMNPDYLFVQFAEAENKDNPKALEDLQKNPIWGSINAVKNDNLFVNLVDPTAQGGTAYSKISFLEALKNSKLVQAK